MRTALIDGDAIAYIMGWNFRDMMDNEDLMEYSIGNFVRTTCALVEADQYIGALSSTPTFRHDVYRYAKYKGTRKEDQDCIKRWKPFVNGILREKWGFVSIKSLEADDIVGYHAYNKDLGDCIICSPDKDLAQIPGELYNYSTGVKEFIDEDTARCNHISLMVCGDTSDNIKGIPGLGPVKLKQKLAEGKSVYNMYVDYFGDYYGTIIYEETLATVMVMSPGHSYESYFEQQLSKLVAIKVPDEMDNLEG